MVINIFLTASWNTNIGCYFGKSYLLCCRAFNAAAAGLMTVGSGVAQDPTIIKLAAAALNALQLNG